MKATNAQRLRWATNALAMAARLPDSADRDTLLQIANDHLRAIERKERRKPTTEKFAAAPTGIW